MTLERARIYCEAGRSREAFTNIQSFLQTEPHHAEGRLIQGRVRAKLGQTEEAIADYNAAINDLPAPAPDLLLERARLQARLGRLAEAARGLDEAISNAPFASPLQLAAIEYDRQRGGFDSALARVDELIQRYPVKEPWLTLRAEVLEQAGRTNEARQTFAQVLAGIETYPAVRRSLELTKQLEHRTRQGLTRVTASNN
ncbi:MAG: tetratricopeptide repeat protein [Verrucomicrobiota bacterium]